MIEVLLLLTISFVGPVPIAVYDNGQQCADEGQAMMELIVANRPDMAPHVHFDCLARRKT